MKSFLESLFESKTKEEFELQLLIGASVISPLDNDIRDIKSKFLYIYKTYGMDPYDFFERLDNQNWTCPVCKGGFDATDNKRPVVDHDHKTGEIRGLIHNHCNLLLGHAFDSSETLRNAAAYLDNYNRARYERMKPVKTEDDIREEAAMYNNKSIYPAQMNSLMYNSF